MQSAERRVQGGKWIGLRPNERAAARRSGVVVHAAFCALLFFASLYGSASAYAQVRPEWWNDAWRYRALVNVPARGPGAYRAWVYAGDRARADGSDFRVVAPQGRLVDRAVVRSTPDGRHLIVFSEPKGDRSGGVYAVYFGNPDAPPARQAAPQAGLILKTMEMPPDTNPGSWRSVSEAMSQARVFGLDFCSQVFIACNPFGPQSRYISSFEGTLDCARTGIYKFATISDDASFLLVDGELVAQWPGQGHNIHTGRHGEKSGQKELAAGRHAFRYVGLAFDGPRIMEAAWMPPGASRFEVIPASAFPSVFIAPVLLTEDSTQPVCAAFAAEETQFLECGDVRMVAVAFTSHSGARLGPVTATAWDFGDGLSSAEESPVHVYFHPGRYTVKLTAASGQASDTFAAPLDVKPLEQDLNFGAAKRQKFWLWVRDYPAGKMTTEDLLRFRTFLKEIEQRRKLFDVGLELDRRRAELNRLQLFSVALELAEYYRDPLRDWRAAEKYYRLALDQCGRQESDRGADIRLKLADLHYYDAGDAARAKAELAALNDELPKSDSRRRRMTALRLGDIERDEGHAEAARKIYLNAESDPTYLPKEPRAVAEGRYTQQIEADLQQAKADPDARQARAEAALAALDQWLWLYPTKRDHGLPVVLRLKAQLLLGDFAEVRRRAAAYLKIGDDADCLPQVQALCGEACAAMGDKAEARRMFRAVVEKWPESPVAEGAKIALDRLK